MPCIFMYVVGIEYIYIPLYVQTYIYTSIEYIDTQHIYRETWYVRVADCCFTFTWFCWRRVRASQALQLPSIISIQQKTPQKRLTSFSTLQRTFVSCEFECEFFCVFVVGLRFASKHIAACCFQLSFIPANFGNYTRSAHSVK